MKNKVDENMMVGLTNYRVRDLPAWARKKFIEEYEKNQEKNDNRRTE